jgi:hypothetical protein
MVRHVDEKFDPGDVVIAHISDPHFGSDRAVDVWPLVINELKRIDPDLYLITGDLVHTPKRSLYELAKSKLEGLPSSRQAKYIVCAGNHDRHWMGNRIGPLLGLVCRHPFRSIPIILWLLATPALLCLLIGAPWLWWTTTLIILAIASYLLRRLGTIVYAGWINAWFNTKFQDSIVGEAPQIVTLGPFRPTDRPWNIGLFGTDSSLEGRMLACGYVLAPTVDLLREARCDSDVAIFLVHHHLLSIAALEGRAPNRWLDLLNATSLMNSGRVMEALTEAHVDIVLHGHEHATNLAGYSSVKPGRGPLRIVAAGSATGNDSFQGCLEDNATFNVLVLSADRSIRMRRYFREAGHWTVQQFPLLDAATLRHSRLRRVHHSQREIDAEITKSLTFNQERDVWVHWVYTNTRIMGRPNLVQRVRNSTGAPDNVRFTVWKSGMDRPIDLGGTSKFIQPHTWDLVSTNLPEHLRGDGPVEITLVYRWRGGGILTEKERLAACSDHQEPLRQQGFEFAVARAPDDADAEDLASMELIVSLPFEYAPTEDPVVRVDNTSIAQELDQQLRVVAPGLFVLRVPYPRKGCDYQVAWRPPARANAATGVDDKSAEQVFKEAAKNRGPELLAAFTKEIAGTAFGDPDSISIYVKRDGPLELELVTPISPASDTAAVPRQVNLLDHKVGLTRAWWGEPNLEIIRRGSKNGDMAHDLLILCLPVRFSFQTIAPPPWGVIRISFATRKILNADRLTEPSNHGRVWEVMFPAVAMMVSQAFRMGSP